MMLSLLFCRRLVFERQEWELEARDEYTSLTNGYLILDMISYKFIFRCPPLH